MTVWSVLLGAGVGVAAGLVAGRAGRARGLAAGYGVSVAALVWFVAAVVKANRVEGMSGLPYAAGAGAVLWFIFVPAVLCVGLLEWTRRAGGPDPTIEPPPAHHRRRPGGTPVDGPPRHVPATMGGVRGASMRLGVILVLVVWGQPILGYVSAFALLLMALFGWVAGARWDAATRDSPHRLVHSLAPWTLVLPWLVARMLSSVLG